VYKGKTVAVVVPAYNEETHIKSVLDEIPDFPDIVIVVNDGSTDHTLQQLQDVQDARLVIIENSFNMGVGASMIRGYEKCIALGVDIAVKVDADGQMPLQYLPTLLDPLVEGYDYAKGNRFLDRRDLRQMPKSRLLGNMVLTFLTKLASGCWHVFDPQNGYTAINAQALKLIDLNRIHRHYFFENDMLVELNIHGCRVKDVPIPAVYGYEESGIRVATILSTFPWLFLRRFVRRICQKYVLRDFSPIALFLVLGALLLTWGIGFGVYLWVRSTLTLVRTSTGTVMLAVLPLILGFQLVLQAIVLDIQETPK